MVPVYAPELYPGRRMSGRTRERDAYLKANQGIDVAILAYAMGLSERFVISYQRRLGLRSCVPATKSKRQS